jgi:hypothetical protein
VYGGQGGIETFLPARNCTANQWGLEPLQKKREGRSSAYENRPLDEIMGRWWGVYDATGKAVLVQIREVMTRIVLCLASSYLL